MSKEITLSDIKKPQDKKTLKRWEDIYGKDDKKLVRYRIEHDMAKWEAYEITHDGNDPRTNKEIISRARWYYSQNLMTDEEFEKYILPAINETITYNDSFIRWMPGSLIKKKETGELKILAYDYGYKYGGRNFTSLSVYDLDKNGKIDGSRAWEFYGDYELVDTEKNNERIRQIADYESGADEDDYEDYCV